MDRLGDQRGGSEWELIKNNFERDPNSNKTNSLDRTPKTTRSTLLPFVCQNYVATEVLLVIGTNTTCSHNSYTHWVVETTQKLSGQQGRFYRGKGWLNRLFLGRQETLQNTSYELQNSPRFHPLDPLVKAKLATRESWRKPTLHPKGPGVVRPATSGSLTSCTQQ
jgi:hypothetical protein